jgi:hypothetical protein
MLHRGATDPRVDAVSTSDQAFYAAVTGTSSPHGAKFLATRVTSVQ